MFDHIAHARDLDAAGITSPRRSALVRAGAIKRLAPAVYGAPDAGARREDRLTTALVRLGPPVAVYGQTGAAHWGLDGFPPDAVPLQVAIPHARGWQRADGVQVIRTRRWADPVTHEGRPVMSVVDTLLVLGGCTTPRRPDGTCRWVATVPELVELAVESALRRKLCTLHELHAAVRAAPARQPGVPVLAGILQVRGDAPVTDSFLEVRVLHALRRGGLGEPQRQVNLGSAVTGPLGKVDFLIGRVAIEADGHEWHDGRSAMQAHHDRERWSDLAAAGFRVQTVTSRKIELAPAAWVERVRAALALDVG